MTDFALRGVNVAAGRNSALAGGFAVVTTDTGHQGSVFDESFMAALC